VGDGAESNYAVSTHEVLVADFSLKLMNVRKVNYTGSVVKISAAWQTYTTAFNG
jgi:hypothetical protein